MEKEKEERKPVALWKGIVGTAVSASILSGVVIFLLLMFLQIGWSIFPYWAIGSGILMLLSSFWLALNIVNLRETIRYKRKHNTQEIEQKASEEPAPKPDDAELLHRLLKEGHITIEEYDRLRGKK